MSHIIGRGRYGRETYPIPGKPPGTNAIVVNRIDVGNIGGSRLVAVDATPLVSGAVVSVFSVGALFQLVKAPSAALIAIIDGITVVQSTFNPAWVWVRMPGTNAVERFSANPPLYIDPVGGNDDNDGLTSPTSLKSLDEWSRRIDGATLQADSILTVKDGNLGRINATTKFKNGAKWTIRGTPNLTGAIRTIGVVTTDSAATGVEEGFTQSAGPALASGTERLRLVGSGTPAHIGAVAFVKGFTGGDVSKPLTSVWTQESLDHSDAVIVTPTLGDTFNVETVDAVIQGIHWTWIPDGPGAGSGYPRFVDVQGAQGSSRGVWYVKTWNKPSENDGHGVFSHVSFSAPGLDTWNDFSQSDVWLSGCDVRSELTLSAFGTFYGIDSCMVRGRITTDTCGWIFVGRTCIDGATGIALSCGPGSICISSGVASVCVSRMNLEGGVARAIKVFTGGEIIGTAMVCWTPSGAGRNGATEGLWQNPGSISTWLGGAYQTDNLRSTSGNTIVLGGVPAAFPTWDSTSGCGAVQEV